MDEYGSALPQGSQSTKSNTWGERKAAAVMASWRMTEELGVRHASLKLRAARVQAAGCVSDETE